MSLGPRVSVGLPVFNAGDYLKDAVESLLGQTFSDFEILIQDNASTDETAEICHTYVERDCRVKYKRNSTNVGAAKNYNLTLNRSRGEYFKWAAHDDVCAPVFLERCVKVLDNDPSVVLCAGKTDLINDDGSIVTYDDGHGCFVTKDGTHVGRLDPPYRAQGSGVAGRYWDILVRTMRTFEIFGLIRTDVLRETILHENYYGSDKVLLADLSLRGRFHMVPEVLLYRRCHAGQSSRLTAAKKGKWIGYRPKGEMATRIQNLIPAYLRVINRAPINFEQKLLCYSILAYRFISPMTWHKQFRLSRYTEAPTP